MNNRLIFFTLILASILALIVETTLINFPFVFFLGAILLLLVKKVRLYILVFIIAFASDSLRVTNFGITPLFLAGLLLLTFLYERYSGSNDILVASLITCCFGFFYASFLGYSMTLTIAFYVSIGIGYFIFSQLKSRKKIYL